MLHRNMRGRHRIVKPTRNARGKGAASVGSHELMTESSQEMAKSGHLQVHV
jgi:hypothetical protein